MRKRIILFLYNGRRREKKNIFQDPNVVATIFATIIVLISSLSTMQIYKYQADLDRQSDRETHVAKIKEKWLEEFHERVASYIVQLQGVENLLPEMLGYTSYGMKYPPMLAARIHNMREEKRRIAITALKIELLLDSDNVRHAKLLTTLREKEKVLWDAYYQVLGGQKYFHGIAITDKWIKEIGRVIEEERRDILYP